MKTPYPGYDVLDKWASPSLDTLTRGVLRRRLHAIPKPRFFDPETFRMLEAICDRLIPQPDRDEPVAIAPWIDADLHEGRSEGFRDPAQPPPAEQWRRGLAGVDAESRRRYVRPFADLDPGSQDATLQAIQAGQADAAGFQGVAPADFFKTLLKAAVGVYYGHPAAWSEVGFGGPASPRGYVRLGLDERDPWEAPIVPAPGDGL